MNGASTHGCPLKTFADTMCGSRSSSRTILRIETYGSTDVCAASANCTLMRKKWGQVFDLALRIFISALAARISDSS